MSGLYPVDTKITADLTHMTDTFADMVHDVHKGIGKILYACYGPFVEKRIGQAKLIAAQTERDSLDILAGKKRVDEIAGMDGPSAEISTLDALCNGLVQTDSACKAKRLMATLLTAATEINQVPEEEISDEPLNQTFFNRWRQEAELIGEEELRQLWAKLLVEETKKTNAISPRTLDVAKNLSRREVDTFIRICQCLFDDLIPVTSDDIPLNGSYADILMLQEAGVLGQISSRWYGPVVVDGMKNTYIPLPENQHVLLVKNPPDKLRIKCHFLTTAGRDLLKFVKRERNFDLEKQIVSEISKQNGNLEIS